ncbi:MAG: acyloxyacyl hydrolase [Terracidiphilus sp.]
MFNPERASLITCLSQLCLALIALIAGSVAACAQSSANGGYYARANTYSFFSAYSDDSSHILMGAAENRKLLEFGAAYGRSLKRNRIVNWQFNAEFLPVALESDPVAHYVNNQTLPTVETFYSHDIGPVGTCHQPTIQYSYVYEGVTYAGTETIACYRRQWTIGEAFSPFGFQFNFMPRHKLQPFFILHGGYMYTTQPIPVQDAGSFNFTFDFGPGIELYRSATKSVRAEYRFHHISDRDTSQDNPGIDNGLFQLTYSFGR